MRIDMAQQNDRARINEKRKTDREQLKDWYVRSLFVAGTKLRASDVPQYIIECKRALIMLKRIIKQKRMN
jgi:hypothetical protein